jgi:hypothetical protein
MQKHEHFEELSALEALGLVTPEEKAELSAHREECASCRNASGDASSLRDRELSVAEQLATLGANGAERQEERREFVRRFFAQAHARGFQFSDDLQMVPPRAERQPLRFLRPRLAMGFALVILASGLVAYYFRQPNRRGDVSLSRGGEGSVSEPSHERDLLRSQTAEDARARTQLAGELERSRKAAELWKSRATTLEEELTKTQAERATGATRIKELEDRLREEEQRLAQLTHDLERMRAARTADQQTLADQQAGIEELSERVRAQAEVVERERELLAAGRDIRELLGAPNLHMIDVYDADGDGKNHKAFGRVFYTEGRSLIFYAFDLGGKVANAKHSFQAWGQLGVAGAAVKSLGIFYLDDQAQKRWVLKFNDPEVLRQIDAVFVTAEPFGGGKKPTGHKILYAYLKQ